MLTSLPLATNGHFESNDQPPYKQGHKAKLICNNGYVSNQFFSFVKDEKGVLTWDPPSVTCTRKSCGAPPLLENGFIKGKEFTFGNDIRYFCNEGFLITPSLSRLYSDIHYCSTSGTWQPPIPKYKCEKIKCAELPNPVNGKVSYSDQFVGSKAHYTCDQGFKILEGDTTRTCQTNGVWTGHPVQCGLVECPSLPANLNIISATKEMAVFTCNGQTKIMKCLPEGKWSISPPYCPGLVSSNKPTSSRKTPITGNVPKNGMIMLLILFFSILCSLYIGYKV